MSANPPPVPLTALEEFRARFWDAWAERGADARDASALLPSRLARAAATTLPAAGAGLSLLVGDFRVPIGASDTMATAAERLQFTVGEGPCLDAAHQRRVLAAEGAELERRWPIFSEELFRRTAYRAVVAVPLPFAPDGALRGALNLMFTEPSAMEAVSLVTAGEVIAQVADALTAEQVLTSAEDETVSDIDEPAPPQWLQTSPARERRRMWIAFGILISALNITADDALALLRSHAYAEDTSVDDVAAAVVDGSLRPDRLRP